MEVSGEVLTDAMRIPVEAGHVLMGVLLNLSQVDGSGRHSLALADSGLDRSGFAAGDSAASGDQVMLFDADARSFNSALRLDSSLPAGIWRSIPDGNPAGATELQAGGGFMILNRGARYWWQQGN
jgi:hypothetical protein